MLAFLSPNSLAGMLWLRCLLAVGCVLLIMWGWLIECSIDIVLWFGLFLLINLLHSLVLIVRLRPIKFDREIEAVSGDDACMGIWDKVMNVERRDPIKLCGALIGTLTVLWRGSEKYRKL